MAERLYFDREDVVALFPAGDPRRTFESVLNALHDRLGSIFRGSSGYWGVENAASPRNVVVYFDPNRSSLGIHNKYIDSLPDDLQARLVPVPNEPRSKIYFLGDPGPSASRTISFPTIEYVKEPADTTSGLPNGQPIRMRHFRDCDHWVRDNHGEWVGDTPRLATAEEMMELSPCQDCLTRARMAHHPESALANNPANGSAPIVAALPLLDLDDTDADAITRVRREQSHLRKFLIGDSESAPCAICGRDLPSSLLVAAHIVPRHLLDDAQRLDFTAAAMLACSLGCDALFELGYLVVNTHGMTHAGKSSDGALKESVTRLAGRRCTAHNDFTGPNFKRHAEIHAKA